MYSSNKCILIFRDYRCLRNHHICADEAQCSEGSTQMGWIRGPRRLLLVSAVAGAQMPVCFENAIELLLQRKDHNADGHTALASFHIVTVCTLDHCHHCLVLLIAFRFAVVALQIAEIAFRNCRVYAKLLCNDAESTDERVVTMTSKTQLPADIPVMRLATCESRVGVAPGSGIAGVAEQQHHGPWCAAVPLGELLLRLYPALLPRNWQRLR